jgi:regulator of sirC expression with transglutaminase-like and TPR domain
MLPGVVASWIAERVLEVLRAEGFSGAEDYYEARNSALDFVLRARRGIPISLAVVVMGVGTRLALGANGINFPGHFLVELERQLVDPFTLEALDETHQRIRLEAVGMRAEEAFRPATARDMVLRMLNNLRGLAEARQNHALALEYTDYQLLLGHELYALRLIRAELWLQLGVPGMSRVELEQALTLATDSATRQRLEVRLKSLTSTQPKLH